MLNKVILIGRLTRDVELRQTPAGRSVASTALATNKKWRDDAGNMQEKTEFHDLVIWRGAENFAKYLSKGNLVYLEGELQTSTWQDKDTGQNRKRTEVVVNDFKFLERKGSGGTGSSEIPTLDNDEDEIKIEDIPF